MAVFHIGHLTDLHFGSVPLSGNIRAAQVRRRLASIWKGRFWMPPTHNPQRAERAAACIYAEAARLENAGDSLDILVLSGDLATTGLPADLDAAEAYVASAPAYLWYRAPGSGVQPNAVELATLQGLADEMLVIPGNHDRFKSNSCEPGGTEFDSRFGSMWQNNDRGVVGKIIFKDGPDGREALAVIGADTCLRGRADATFRIGELSQGFLHSDTFAALKEKTDKARSLHPDIVVIWFFHFPPHASISLLHCMRNYHLIEAAARGYGIKVILSGHTHENCAYYGGSIVPIWNGGSLCQYAEPEGNWFQMLEIEIRKNNFVRAHRRNFEWDNVGGTRDFYSRHTDNL